MHSSTRKSLALLFVDLSSSTLLAERMEAEPFADVVGIVLGICRQEVERLHGMVVRLQGDGMLAAFGLPEAAEDDGRRACDAALAIHVAVRGLAPVELRDGTRHRLQVHSGVHAGLVLVSEGSIEVGRLQLLGDGPNTAARLAAMARADQILVDAETVGPALAYFIHGPAFATKLPGRQAPARVLDILDHSGLLDRLDASLQRGLSPLLGRSRTLEQVVKALDAAALENRQQVVVVHGESGVGKSRFLAELTGALERRGECTLHGRCDSHAQAPGLLPFMDLLARLEAQPAEVTGHSDGNMPPAELKKRMIAAVSRAGSGRAPVTMLDDWQWADDASRGLLTELLDHCRFLRVVLASRPIADASDGLERAMHVWLTPFTPEESLETVLRLAPGTDPFVAAEIHEYAGGVPLFVEELCHALSGLGAYGLRALRSGGGQAGTPGWMAALVASRVARLTAAQRQTVETAAVLGIRVPIRLIQHTLGATVSTADLHALAGADLLYPAEGDWVAFKHGLTRDAVYELISLQRRRALHAHVVEALREPSLSLRAFDFVEALAQHCTAAAMWREATQHCEAAGDKAMQLFALDRARAHYLSAITAADREDDTSAAAELRWCHVAHKLGMTWVFDPLALPDAKAIFERSLERAKRTGDVPTIARSAYWLGYVMYTSGNPRRAAGHLQFALAQAQKCADPRLIAQMEAALGQALAAGGRYEAALCLMASGLVAKRQNVRTGSAVAVGSAFTLACQASVWADQGDFSRAHVALNEAHELVGNSSHPVSNSIRNWQMVVLAWQGRWDEALDVVGQSVAIAEYSRALLPLAIARTVGGYARFMHHRDDDGFEQMRQAVRWIEQRGGSFYTSIYYGWLVAMSVARGRNEDARLYARQLAARARVGEQLGLSTGWRALALVAARDDHALALRYLGRADAAARRRDSRREQALNDLRRASLMSQSGQAPEALQLSASARERLRAMGMTGFESADPTGPL